MITYTSVLLYKMVLSGLVHYFSAFGTGYNIIELIRYIGKIVVKCTIIYLEKEIIYNN